MAVTGLLAGRIALVTGGGSGIGRAVCQVFAREGAKVAVVDQSESGVNETIKLIGSGNNNGFQADVSSSKSVAELLSNVKSTFSGVPTVLVNSAGIVRDSFFLKMSEEQFDQVINVNLKGTFLMTQALCRLLVQNEIKKGSIVNLSSIVGEMGNIGQSNYAASKAGVVAFTKTVAQEMGRSGIRINAVLPGFIQTPMTSGVPDKVKSMLTSMTPLQREGQPEEIAEACLFLASDRSSYVTGTTLKVTGGL